MKKIYFIRRVLFGKAIALLALILPLFTYSQTITYTFTSANASGSVGPTQAMVTSAYLATNLNGSVVVTGSGIQTWTVPTTGLYLIDISGASGGNTNNTYNKLGGLGARMQGEFNLTGGTVLSILVGQKGPDGCGTAGGGGGSYVVNNGTILIAAGGGGGASSDNNAANATTLTSGTQDNPPVSLGGVNGQGGQICNSSVNNGGSGAGYAGNGQTPNSGGGGGMSFLNGGLGGASTGASNPPGGFGGGGGGTNCTVGGGGGGGYSGGAGGQQVGYCVANVNRSGGGGGGSYNIGSNQVNSNAFQTGNGRVIITSLCNIAIYATSNPLCAGNTITLTTNAVGNYTWSNGSNSSSIVITPSASAAYSLAGTSTLNCLATTMLNVTVSPGLPVLAVTSSTDNLCLGKSAVLTASGAITYTWTNNVINGVPFIPNSTNTYTVTGENGCGTTTAVTTITVAPLPVTVMNTPSIACAGLSTTLSASSAVNNYTWQPVSLYTQTIVVNPTVNTVYTVTASDGTCSGVATLSLNTLPVPTIGVVANTSMACVGYPVTMSATGGLTYTWLPGNLSGQTVTVYPAGPTLYTVNGVNSVGCVTGTTQIVLTEVSPSVNVSANATLICIGDVVTLTAGGNAGGYTWTGGPSTPNYSVSPSGTTVYTVTGTSQTNTCTTTKVITVNVFSPSLSVTSSTSTVCSGKEVTLTASGYENYFWTNNSSSSDFITDNPTSTTIYTVTATSTTINALSCNKTGTVQVNVNPNPTVTASSSRTLICKDESTDLNASGAQSYVWSTGATGASTIVFPPGITIHTYSVTGTDANGCSGNTTILIRVTGCNSIMDHGAEMLSLAAYPNPAQGAFMIESSADVTVRVLNALGQETRVIKLTVANDHKSEVKGLSRGLYFISVDGKKDLTKKIVIE